LIRSWRIARPRAGWGFLERSKGDGQCEDAQET
jgi:hypothetical protein